MCSFKVAESGGHLTTLVCVESLPGPLSKQMTACSLLCCDVFASGHLHFTRWPRCYEGFFLKEERGRYEIPSESY